MVDGAMRSSVDRATVANRRGNEAMRAGDYALARACFSDAVAADPGQPALLFNLAGACHASGQDREALTALDAALAVDPYFVQAVFQKAIIFGKLGADRDAARIFRDFLDMVPPEVEEGQRFAEAIAHARRVVELDNRKLAADLSGLLSTATRRIRGALHHLTGLAPLYRSEPTFLTVPELPAIPFLAHEEAPWLQLLEAEWRTVLAEAEAVLRGPYDDFRPYVGLPAGVPANQWRELNHNPAWGAFFLWKHGVRHERNCALMPRTAALVERLPLVRLDGRAPNVLLSRLAPRTRIPPHNGVTNARMTVHLPLIVPPGCGFRVGPETREWQPGIAWAFDDTIDHEAWNDSADSRLILILDVWNPFLRDTERSCLAAALGRYDAHYGLQPGRDAEI